MSEKESAAAELRSNLLGYAHWVTLPGRLYMHVVPAAQHTVVQCVHQLQAGEHPQVLIWMIFRPPTVYTPPVQTPVRLVTSFRDNSKVGTSKLNR